ncbi:MAG: PEP-CTERM sorting domain-containing protein [Candidatus Omnitrophica bacterium]|nr:PEP-CTERM sorting domain-containing protein [Candidatus Omnitrophota bacterium]
MLKVGRCIGLFLVLCLGCVGTQTAQAVSLDFDLFNHPDGNSQPPPYGLRLDYNGENHTFDFGPGVSAIFDLTNKSLAITGSAIHGKGSASTGEAWNISASLTWVGIEGVSSTDFNNLTESDLETIRNNLITPLGLFGSGDRLIFDVNSLTLTTSVVSPMFQGATSWSGKGDGSGNQFYIGTGHRGASGLSGWGWVMTPTGQTGTNDFLFTLEANPSEVPEPTSIALLTAGLGALVSRKRRG